MRKLSDYKETYCMRAGAMSVNWEWSLALRELRVTLLSVLHHTSTQQGEGCAPQLPPTVLSAYTVFAFFCGPF